MVRGFSLSDKACRGAGPESCRMPNDPGPGFGSVGHRRLRVAGRVIRYVLVVYLSLVLVTMWFEESIVFPAPRYPQGDWDPPGLPHRDVRFTSEDGTRLHGWFFGHPEPRGHLLYCHGNADFVPNLGTYADMLRQRYRLSVLVFDYRGYGRSEGTPNESGVLADARAALAWLAETGKVADHEVVLMGRSLGGAVAVDLAARSGARALILENTFTSAPDVGAHHFRWLPVRLLMRTQLNALARIPDYRGPLLQSHGTADEVVPLGLGERLFDAAPGPKQFVAIPGARHNDPQPMSYYDTLGEFLDHVLD